MATGKTTSGASFITRQPGKTLWVLLAVGLTVVRLPFWLVAYILRSLRQHPKWTYRQALAVSFLKQFLYHTSAIRQAPSLSLDPGKEKECFVVMRPSREDVYQGVLQDSQIKPTAVGGTWYPSPFRQGDKLPQRVVLHFHGGAYVIGLGRRKDAGYEGDMLAKHVAEKALLLQYRLSSTPGGRFPAALQDAVTSYQYLLDIGVPASSIVVSGDSAGGNMCVALLRYISDHKGLLPAPSAALLWSPWLNVASCQEPGLVERNDHYATDYLTSSFVIWGATTFVPDNMSADNTYISPYSAPFETETPVWVQTCGAECLRDEGEAFAKLMKGLAGNKVEYYEEPDAPHDLLIVGEMVAMKEKAEHVARMARNFLNSL